MQNFVEEYFPSAEEMRIKSKLVMSKETREELRRIFKEIEAAAARGERTLNKDGVLSRQVRSKLEDLGYKVEIGSQYNESYYIIRW